MDNEVQVEEESAYEVVQVEVTESTCTYSSDPVGLNVLLSSQDTAKRMGIQSKDTNHNTECMDINEPDIRQNSVNIGTQEPDARVSSHYVNTQEMGVKQSQSNMDKQELASRHSPDKMEIETVCMEAQEPGVRQYPDMGIQNMSERHNSDKLGTVNTDTQELGMQHSSDNVGAEKTSTSSLGLQIIGMRQRPERMSTLDPTIRERQENIGTLDSATHCSQDDFIRSTHYNMVTHDPATVESQDNLVTQDPDTLPSPDNMVAQDPTTVPSPDNLVIQDSSIVPSPNNMVTQDPAMRPSPNNMVTEEPAIVPISDHLVSQDPTTVVSTNNTLTQSPSMRQSPDNIINQDPATVQIPDSLVTQDPITIQNPDNLDFQHPVIRPCSDIMHNQGPSTTPIPFIVGSQDSATRTSPHKMGSQDPATFPNTDNVNTQDSAARHGLDILYISETSTRTSSYNMESQEPAVRQNPENIVTKEPATVLNPGNQDPATVQSQDSIVLSDPAMKQSSYDTSTQGLAMGQNIHILGTQKIDVIGSQDYTEQMSHTQMACVPSISCSVSDVCSVYQSYFSQAPHSILIQSDAPGTAFSTSSSVGCIVTSSEVSNTDNTRYLILPEPADAPSNGPVTVSPVVAAELPSSHGSSPLPEGISDMEALEGMVETVIVQQYKCKMCKYKSASKNTLLRHVQKHHLQKVSREEKKNRSGKSARPKEEEEEDEDDDIVDAGAIDDPDDDSDYNPGEDTPRSHAPESPRRAASKDRPCRRPGRPRKYPRLNGPELNSTALPVSTNDSQADPSIAHSDLENKDPSTCQGNEQEIIPKRLRGRPPKGFRGRKYRRYRGSRYYKPPNKRFLKAFLCRICGSRFLTHDDLTFHVNSHDGNDPQAFRCQQCSYKCRRWSSLKEHMFNHKGNKPYKCEECEYTSVYKKDVIRHSAVHQVGRKKKADMVSKSSSFPCPVCNRIYSMQKRLTQHLKTHSSEKPHMCDKCGKAFKKRYTFKMHLLTHLQNVGNSRYKCEFCEYICEDRKELLNHQFTHMNDKPFKCSQCTYQTFRQDFLLTHQATKHSGGKPFSCDYCHFSTKHKKNLRLHVQCRHSDKFNEWAQRYPEEAPCRRRPFFSKQQIEELKQQHNQSGNRVPSHTNRGHIQEVQVSSEELAYHMLHQTTQLHGDEQSQNPLGAAAVIYEQGGDEEDLTTRAALDLLLNMSAQREGPGGTLQVAVVKSGSCEEGQGSEVAAQEPQMAQVLTLHMDERDMEGVQETGYEEADVQEVGYEGAAVQQITINTAFGAAEYSLINAENIQTSLCSDADAAPRSPQMLAEGMKKGALQILHKPQQADVAPELSSQRPSVKKFCCKICGSAFWGRAEMENHKRAHIEGGNGFKCHDCDFVAVSWDDVRIHMTVHTKLRPHRCPLCSFASKSKRDLNRHALTHSNQRPHSCHLCGQRFTRKGHLQFHLQRLHKGGNIEQPDNEELTAAPSLEEEHIFLAQEETVTTNQEDTAYIQEITTADGQTLQQLVTADNQVQYIISQEDIPHLIPQEYVVLPGHHIQVQDGQITHIQYEPGTPFLQDPQIHFVPMSPSQQLLTQEVLQAAAHSAVTAVADAAMAQTVYNAETEPPMQQEIQYDVITLGE
ncbi:zinc finger protein 335 [Rhinophrynus dorsalis]